MPFLVTTWAKLLLKLLLLTMDHGTQIAIARSLKMSQHLETAQAPHGTNCADGLRHQQLMQPC